MSFWDYLIVTASNARQAQAYEGHLRLRRELGLLPQVRECLVAAVGATLEEVWDVYRAHYGTFKESSVLVESV